MNTPVEELEQQLRTHYRQGIGEPPSATVFWEQLAARLPERSQPLSWWLRILPARALTFVAPPAPTRVTPVRRLAIAFAILCALLLVSGIVYMAGLPWLRQGNRATTGSAVSAADSLLLQQLMLNHSAQSDLFTTVNLSQTAGGRTVTLQKVLADANDFVLGYTVHGDNSVTMEFSPVITLPNGQKLSSEFGDASRLGLNTRGCPPGLLDPCGGPGGTPPTSSTPYAVLAFFNAASIQGNSRQLTLHIDIPVNGITFHFYPTVPFYAGKTITVNKSVTSDGLTITLHRVVITPVETCFYYSMNHATDLSFIWRLSVAGKSYAASGGYDGSSIRSDGENYVSFLAALQHRTGTWTFDVSEWGGKGSWRIPFTVPEN